ncbi:universal stress protein [Mycolicibacterium elephantis]|uniref:universal stress protein n=1 Tax=Mycolicibacterium elephantis TaxID=81858 RepID=UPI000FE19D88|nr:universal stress protein [Mycolicibacterium elephantis]MCV7221222.1 universal stress protein [Mycolicibacterium elephantis]
MTTKEPATGPIIVGVDASESSRAAVAWAAHDAELRGLPLRLVQARTTRRSTWSTLCCRTPQARQEIDPHDDAIRHARYRLRDIALVRLRRGDRPVLLNSPR